MAGKHLILSLLLPILLVSSCGAQSGTLMREDFNSAPPGWTSWHAESAGHTITVYGLNVYGGIGYSYSYYPMLWGVDRNHGDPGGLGDLAMTYHVCLPANTNGCVSNVPTMDLRGATLRLRIRTRCCEGAYPSGGIANAGPSSASGTRLVWWFQTFDPAQGKYINMAAIGTPLDTALEDGEWHVVEIAPKMNDWACLGSIETKTYLYSCNPAHIALANANIGMGLIYFPLDRTNLPVGRIEVDWIEVFK